MSKHHDITAIVQDKRGRTISIGRNSYTKTHPLMAKTGKLYNNSKRIYLHAEIAALVKLKDWAKAYKIIISRFDANGNPALAKPCLQCQHVIKLTGIKHVEHT